MEDEYRRKIHIMDHIDPVIINLDDSYRYNEELVKEPIEYVNIESEKESWTIWIQMVIFKKIYTVPFGVGG